MQKGIVVFLSLQQFFFFFFNVIILLDALNILSDGEHTVILSADSCI